MKNILILIILTNLIFAQSNPIIGYKSDKIWGESDYAAWLLNRVLLEEYNAVWSTGNHTASPVPLGVVGPDKYSKQLKGVIQNTKIAEVLKGAVADGISVILVIGDGMGYTHMTLPIYMNVAKENNKKTYFEKIMEEGESGIVLTNPHGEIITSSAAAGTAIATGTKTLVGMLGLGPDGYQLESILDVAEKNNLSTGIISDAPVTHATPGAFYGHSITRNDQNLIAEQLIDDNEIEVVLGGGASYFIPQNTKIKDHIEFADLNNELNEDSWRKDDRNLVREAIKKGYKFVSSKDELKSIEPNTKKLLGLFASYGINAAIDRESNNTGEPALIDLSKHAFHILKKDPKGYFLMIEAARIDWEAHANDMGAVLKATNEMDNVLEHCYNEYKSNPEKTMFVFTADHETGGFGLSYHYYDKKDRIQKELESGLKYTGKKDNLPFEEFIKIENQKETIDLIFSKVKSVNDLIKSIEDNFNTVLTKEEAELIFKHIKVEGYK